MIVEKPSLSPHGSQSTPPQVPEKSHWSPPVIRPSADRTSSHGKEVPSTSYHAADPARSYYAGPSTPLHGGSSTPCIAVAPRAPSSATAAPEQPPPYAIEEFHNVSAALPPIAPQSDIHSVNHIHIHNRNQNVLGTYCIDPTIPEPAKFKSKIKPWKGFGGKAVTPSASFRTRRGAISINLATKGGTAGKSKAYVQAASQKGDITINLYSLQQDRHLNLDVYSKKGDALLLIPRNFCGVIHLKGRKKACMILPALASVSRLLQAKDDDMFILIGDPSAVSDNTPGQPDDLSTDFCQVSSRSGKVVAGFTGEDKYVPEPPGMWQKLFGRT